MTTRVKDGLQAYRRFWEGSFDSLADYLERGVTQADRAAAAKGSKARRE